MINKDLLKERSKSNFNGEHLYSLLLGKERRDMFFKVLDILSRNKVLSDASYLWGVDKVSRYERAVENGAEIIKIIREYGFQKNLYALTILEYMSPDDCFLFLHITMFTSALSVLCDDEQREWWLWKAQNCEIIGTYAQTELSHGSNVPGLATTADLDLEKDEWIINTPTLESIKWWPGGLGKSCTHVILMADLRIKGKSYGIHPYMLPVRDMVTHRSLKGITIWDIGSKLGYNGMDNGAMRLEEVRIPRRYLLGGFVEVDPFGNYAKKGDDRMLYQTMTFTRAMIIIGAGLFLAKAAVVATRYSAVRRQFPMELDRNAQEVQVLDYSTQQMAVFPQMAAAVAYATIGTQSFSFYEATLEQFRVGDFSRLKEIHVYTSALKATLTMDVADGIESLRKSLGGHGYMLASGLPLMFQDYVPQATYEGDFVVLSIQCGRAIMKLIQDRLSGKVDPMLKGSSLEYIVNFDIENPHQTPPDECPPPTLLKDKNWLISAYERRANILIYHTGRKFMEAMGEMPPLAALDSVKIEMTKITIAHAQLLVVRSILDIVDTITDQSMKEIIYLLSRIFAIYKIDKHFNEFAAAGIFQPIHEDEVLECVKAMNKEFRPHAVTFADAWHFPDSILNSALGRFDGNVYQALFDSLAMEPLNSQDVAPAYFKYLHDMLHPPRSNL